MGKAEKPKISPKARKTPTKRPSKKAPIRVDEQDKASWRQSRIPEANQINKTRAKQEYKLNDKELKGLTMARTSVNHSYNEREVEMKAWEKFGGPDAFQRMLDDREAKYKLDGKDKTKPFARPTPYCSSEVEIELCSVPIMPGSNSFVHPATVSTPFLVETRDELLGTGREWQWDAINNALEDHADSMDIAYLQGKDRECAVKSALEYLEQYPDRPTSSEFPGSTSFSSLKSLLERAPVLRPDGERPDGEETDDDEYDEGLDFYDHPDMGPSVDWGYSYCGELFAHLTKLTEEHGLDGWKMARWLVCDKYVECKLGGIECRETDDWYDDGLFLLTAEKPLRRIQSYHVLWDCFDLLFIPCVKAFSCTKYIDGIRTEVWD